MSVLVERRAHATCVERCTLLMHAQRINDINRDARLFIRMGFLICLLICMCIVSTRLDAVYVFSKRPKSTLTANAAHNANG